MMPSKSVDKFFNIAVTPLTQRYIKSSMKCELGITAKSSAYY